MHRKIRRIMIAAVFILFTAMGYAYAEELGVIRIGVSDVQNISLGDIQLGAGYTIDGYAKILPKEFLIVDYFAQFTKDADYTSVNDSYRKDHVYYEKAALDGSWAYYYNQALWNESGLNAEYIWLQVDVVNLQKKSIKYMEEVAVSVVYNEEYVFPGWVLQANYDYNTHVYRYNSSTEGGPFAVIHSDNEEAINMMYTGTYVFGCTLPNYVIEDKKAPLQIRIVLGGNEIVYNIRR